MTFCQLPIGAKFDLFPWPQWLLAQTYCIKESPTTYIDHTGALYRIHHFDVRVYLFTEEDNS